MIENIQDIQDIYELSPIQKGMLFHSFYAPELGLYFMQMSYKIRGNLNMVAFDRALQKLATRHTILRTSFYWEEADKPLQVVRRQVKVPLEEQDWRGIDPVEQQKRLESLVKSERERGFNFSQAPLMRMSVIRLADQVYQILQNTHHVILDGWSDTEIIGELVQLYQAFCNGKEVSLAPGIPFKNYISWLRKQNLSRAEVYWRRILSKVKAPTPLTYLESENLFSQEERYDEEQIKLSAATTAELQSLAKQHQLTLNTLFQGAWALLLGRYSCQNQVVYGCTVSGRPVDLEGVESMLGVFVNTLPVRVNVNPEQYLLPWLKQLQAQLVEIREYEHSPLTEVQGWSEVPRDVPLFESIAVFEKFPVPKTLKKEDKDLQFFNFTTYYKTNYPLNVIGYPDLEFKLGINYDCHRFALATITDILRHFQILLQGMVANPEVRLKDLSLLTPAQQQFSLTLTKEATFDWNFASYSQVSS
ncbi:MAG: non-ribosomal peptide synthetase [Symploca sp. SIO2G7]|nr:non-ribosomal peptide synthetase [Symploca sp. SIO2G7]